LIAGRVATASDSPVAKQLHVVYSTAIGKTFKRVNAFWVGPKAMEHLKRGGRLTFGAAAAPEFDLQSPAA